MDKLELAKYIVAFIYQKEDINIMKSIQRTDYIECGYHNKDNELIGNKLKFIEEDRVVWGIVNGRWRDHHMDTQIFYKVHKGIVVVREMHKGNLVGVESYIIKE